MGLDIVQDIITLFLVAVPVVLLCVRFNFPPLIGFMVSGMLVGPFGLGFIEDPNVIETLAEVGMVLLLFTVGLEFSFQEFTLLRRESLFGGTLQVGLTILVCLIIGLVVGWPWHRSLYFGAVVSLSSTAVVLASLSERKALVSQEAKIATGILIYQDLMVIPFLAFLPLLIDSDGGKATLSSTLAMALAKVVILVGVCLLLHRWLLTPIWKAVVKSKSRELVIATLFVQAMGLGWLSRELGLSYALGAFLGGLLLSATEYRFYALSEVLPFRYGFSSLFFASLGMLLDFSFILNHVGIVALAIIFVPLLKCVITTLGIRLLGASLGTALAVGVLLGQIGEFSYLLAHQGYKLGVLSPFFYQLIIACTAITLVITPFFALSSLKARHWFPGLFTKHPRSLLFAARTENKKHDFSKHVILCGFGVLGQTIATLLGNKNIPYVIIEMNPKLYHRFLKRDFPIQLGDGSSETILLRASIDKAKVLAIAVPDYMNATVMIKKAREFNKELFIVARAHYHHQSEFLYAAGADVVVSEELEGGIEMGRYLLRYLGGSEEEVNRITKVIRDFGSADFF